MPNVWMIGDGTLQSLATAQVEWLRLQTNWQVRLYQNDYSPVATSDYSDFTESTFAGYATYDIDSLLWGSAALVDHIVSSTSSAVNNYTVGLQAPPGQPCYGYFVNDGLEQLVWAERFATPRQLQTGDVLTLQLIYRFQTLPS